MGAAARKVRAYATMWSPCLWEAQQVVRSGLWTKKLATAKVNRLAEFLANMQGDFIPTVPSAACGGKLSKAE